MEFLPEVRAHIAKASHRELESADIIGVHGTSLETLELVLKTGYLPGRPAQLSRQYAAKKGDLYFLPLRKFPNIPDDPLSLEEAAQGVSAYAKQLARSLFVASKLGLDIRRGFQYTFTDEVASDWIYPRRLERLIKVLETRYRIQRADIIAARECMNYRKGVIFGLSLGLLNFYTPLPGDKDVGDVRISVGEGLNYRFLSVVLPLGEQEFDFLQRLRVK